MHACATHSINGAACLPARVGQPSRAARTVSTYQKAGDILIKGITGEYFELVEIATGKVISGPIAGLPAAIAAARTTTRPGAIWQQHSDDRGRLRKGTLSRKIPSGDRRRFRGAK